MPARNLFTRQNERRAWFQSNEASVRIKIQVISKSKNPGFNIAWSLSHIFGRGGVGLLWLICVGGVPTASQSLYPIIVYNVFCGQL